MGRVSKTDVILSFCSSLCLNTCWCQISLYSYHLQWFIMPGEVMLRKCFVILSLLMGTDLTVAQYSAKICSNYPDSAESCRFPIKELVVLLLPPGSYVKVPLSETLQPPYCPQWVSGEKCERLGRCETTLSDQKVEKLYISAGQIPFKSANMCSLMVNGPVYSSHASC